MLVLKNPGLIPIEAATSMGVNVKLNEASAIGHFGTGLKIAICVILRNGGQISIYRDGKEHRFFTKTKDIRGKEFDFVMMQTPKGPAQQLSMTTELGKNWQPWMAMRELESNCRDEDGESFTANLAEALTHPAKGNTVVIVKCPTVEQAWEDRADYFIVSEPLEHHVHFDVHAGAGTAFFYKGIKVGDFEKPMPFTFNFKGNLQSYLTEDRTMHSYYVKPKLASHIPELKRKDM